MSPSITILAAFVMKLVVREGKRGLEGTQRGDKGTTNVGQIRVLLGLKKFLLL